MPNEHGPSYNILKTLIVGREFAGKTNYIGNLLLREEFYLNEYDGNDIYVVCPQSTLDDRIWKTIIENKGIPKENIHSSFSDEELHELFCTLANRETEKPIIVVFDDFPFIKSFPPPKFPIEFVTNGKSYRISLIITAKMYSSIPEIIREGVSEYILFDCSQKQLNLIYNDIGQQTKDEFCRAFREATNKPHTFMSVNRK